MISRSTEQVPHGPGKWGTYHVPPRGEDIPTVIDAAIATVTHQRPPHYLFLGLPREITHVECHFTRPSITIAATTAPAYPMENVAAP